MLQFITHTNNHYSYFDSALLALAGGCKWIQLRMKEATDDEVRDVAFQLKPFCHRRGAKLIIDDRVDVAISVGADGVHLGRNDMPVSEARRRVGDKFIIGGTANTIDDVVRLHAEGADYIGCGPFRFTTTKKNLSPILGLDGYRRIVSEARRRGIALPIVAIGGITCDDIPQIMQTGVTGIALSGSILRAEKPIEEMRKVISIVKSPL